MRPVGAERTLTASTCAVATSVPPAAGAAGAAWTADARSPSAHRAPTARAERARDGDSRRLRDGVGGQPVSRGALRTTFATLAAAMWGFFFLALGLWCTTATLALTADPVTGAEAAATNVAGGVSSAGAARRAAGA